MTAYAVIDRVRAREIIYMFCFMFILFIIPQYYIRNTNI